MVDLKKCNKCDYNKIDEYPELDILKKSEKRNLKCHMCNYNKIDDYVYGATSGCICEHPDKKDIDICPIQDEWDRSCSLARRRVVLLNTSMLTSYGCFKYRGSSLIEVCHMLSDAVDDGVEILSTIGHQSTADILSSLFKTEVKVNRIEYKQEISDTAIVFKLNGRPPEGKILTWEEIEKIGYTFGIIEMK